MARYAYRNIRTPILEHTQPFVRGIGEVTDSRKGNVFILKTAYQAWRPRPPDDASASPPRRIQLAAMMQASGPTTWARCFAASGRNAVATTVTRSVEALGLCRPGSDAELTCYCSALEGTGLSDWRLKPV
jgi:histidyl-tRNA synthetase